MIRLFVRHDVADYAAWRKGYDGATELRRSGGVIGDGIFVSLENDNDVTVYNDFETAEAAQAFASSPELKAAMQELGVVGAPTIWMTREG
ncbi:MAG: antibiotic biosynthesis monooxygenase [Chloroflexota bacterium]